MKYYAEFNDAGFPTAFYCDEIHGDAVLLAAIEISEEQWREFIDNPGGRRWQDGQVVEYSPPSVEPATILPAVTLWERLTESEAEQVNAAMATQPFRTRQIFLTANTFRSDHELWPLLVQMATELFGEERAAELLMA
ncbi:hypothetical protein NIK97_12135 [Brucella pseudintermedia]|uniref:DUF4376 domain-containing protein n=1 Tax=Brucella pseudintermedia TaxID=370111 RepID=A0ABY5UJW7_9HYPH|nr:hypothetical protein [Brucella pseudintermedia]UWL62294.1 hypothetical protein NIK97_12135 [Brucella pseudintermedia]